MWSSAAAFAYFTGGSLYAWLGGGAVFWVPAAIFALGLVVTRWLAGRATSARVGPAPAPGPPHATQPASTSVPARTFLQLGWLANPLSFVAIFTLIALMPGLAAKFALRPGQVGLFCSIWLFGRLAAFVWLWHWAGWHYRFRWLAGGYLLLVGSFGVVLLSPDLAVVMLAQVAFGVACGLLYYSSLFYSMDVGEARAELGGLHEAALGVGIFAGPAVGALSGYLLPGQPHASAVAVSGLLAIGFAALVGIWARGRTR
jgi:hypothetical protein